MSTVTLSQPHWAITSAENPEGIANHPLTAALPAFHLSFSLFSATPYPFSYRAIAPRHQSAAQIRTRLSLMRMAPMYHHIGPVEPAFEKVPIDLELERVWHDTRGIREHALLGDDGITFDATRTGRNHLL
jgi:hypothetical protein